MSNSLYRSTFTKEDLITKDETVLIQGDYVLIGENIVLADERIGMGYGENNTQQNAQGRLFFDAKDTADAPIEGTFRIMTMSSQNIPLGTKPVLIDIDLASIRSGANVRSEQIPFPFSNVLLSRDKKFNIYIKARETGKTLSKVNSDMLVDITRELVR